MSTTTQTSKESSNGGQTQNRKPPKRTTIMRIIGRTMLGIIILLGLSMVINWLLIIPKAPTYNVETCNVTANALTDRNLNATLAFTIKTSNPNRRAAIDIDSMRVTVEYLGQRFRSTVPSFSLAPGKQTLLKPAVEVFSTSPFGNLNDTVRSNGFEVDLRLEAKIRYAIEKWTSKRRSLEIYCDLVGGLKINTSTPLDNKKCRVDL
ncbi:NDR1/HIN1-like protein 10 [Momordica charantia]|uniref:NDR1/HIN1-like protein 10 n=1 Tax=Momordica charantia TaxID=3673 RepID=A0A6J1DG76_MOMCH|nr:NDR1/HIN1-like protein 10 [Momordica charantia]